MNQTMMNYFKAFADENRMKIIELLIKGDTCGCTLIDQLSISQPTLSYHLKQLEQIGLASNKRDGNKIKYTINRNKLNDMMTYLQQLRDMEEAPCEI